MTKAFYITAAELAQKGKDNIPDEKISNFQFFHNITPLLSLLH